MKTLSVSLFLFFIAFSFQACNNGTDSETMANDANKESMKDSTAAPTVESDDSKFLVKAASGGMMEVELGNLALQKGMSQQVKDFGAMMVRDHTAANNELKTLAASKNIVVPAAMGDNEQKHVTDLSEKSGNDFDKEYIDLMVSDHKDDIDMFQNEADHGNDADVKAFAMKTLPVLNTHLSEAQKTQDMVKNMKH